MEKPNFKCDEPFGDDNLAQIVKLVPLVDLDIIKIEWSLPDYS